MSDQAGNEFATAKSGPGDTLHKKNFWSKENLKYSEPHFRLQKCARLINKIAPGGECALLDVGCGPAALMPLLRPNIRYYGIDIAIHEEAPNLVEADFLEAPIEFDDNYFDIVVAQGVFEYVGSFQDHLFAEIARLLTDHGKFIVSYVNFGHWNKNIYWPYSNVQPLETFRHRLARYFTVEKSFPTSHNWHHLEPSRKLIKATNMHINMNIPAVSKLLAVEYFFVCSAVNRK